MLLCLSLLVLLAVLLMARTVPGTLLRTSFAIFLVVPAGVWALALVAPLIQEWPWLTLALSTLGMGLVPSSPKR